MATYDLTSSDTLFVNSDSIATEVTNEGANFLRVIETHLDVAKMIENGYVMAAGDVFQALEVPAGFLVLAAGAEVTTAFDGTTPTVDVDFAGGDDMVDGGDVSAAGFLAGGTNGQGLVVGGTPTFTQLVSTTDTVDVTLNAGASDVTTGVMRLFVVAVDLNETGRVIPTEVTRDQLA